MTMKMQKLLGKVRREKDPHGPAWQTSANKSETSKEDRDNPVKDEVEIKIGI
jgi:hypothetical protein